MSILWIILIVVLVLALLGFVGRGRPKAPATQGAARIGRPCGSLVRPRIFGNRS